jgi:CheY-like chemotaxis protein
MPVVSGYELCAQIRRISAFKDVPIIIMTNNNSIPDRVRAKVVGSTGFLGKPIKPKRVLKVVLKHLHSEPVAAPDPVHFHSSLLPSV